jgi:uncharacterized protein (DUF362 family)
MKTIPDHRALDRRNFVKLMAAGGIAAAAAPLVDHPLLLAQITPPSKPATNIKDALKIPRSSLSLPGKFPGKVVKSTNENSIAGGIPDVDVLDKMLSRSLLALTGASTIDRAWRQFVAPDDIVGLKVNPVAGKTLSTSPELAHVIISQLKSAGIPAKNIVLWDRREFELHEAGFTPENFPGIRILGTEQKDAAGSFVDAGGKLYGERMIDRDWYYWADVEEKYDAETLPYMINEGKNSYFSRICTKDVTKIINIPILKNAGPTVTLCLKNLAFGAISNTGRLHKQLWAETCAEVPAFAPLRDRVVLNIVDGIKGCYNGGPGAEPQFFTEYKTLLVGTDPVAVDRIGYEIVLKKRLEEKVQKEESPRGKTFLDLAAAQNLGVADLKKIDIETVS